MRNNKVDLVLLLACIVSILALMPNKAMAEAVHQPTEDTAVVVATAINTGAVVNNATNELRGVGYTVTLLNPDNSTVNNLRSGLDVGVIVWIGHGDYVGGQVILATSEWAFEGRDATLLYNKYKADFDNGRVVWRNVTIPDPTDPLTICHVYIAPSFISYYYDGLPNSLWYTCSCFSLCDDSMAQAFLDSGGAVYMGWSNKVGVGYGISATMEVMDLLCLGYTVSEVVSRGYEEPNPPHATLDYEGDGEFSVAEKEYVNLVVQVPQAPAGGVSVWVDGVRYTSPVSITVAWGPHTIEVQSSFRKEEWKPGWYYIYMFDHWSDGSENNPRTVYVLEDATFTAIYIRLPWAIR